MRLSLWPPPSKLHQYTNARRVARETVKSKQPARIYETLPPSKLSEQPGERAEPDQGSPAADPASSIQDKLIFQTDPRKRTNGTNESVLPSSFLPSILRSPPRRLNIYRRRWTDGIKPGQRVVCIRPLEKTLAARTAVAHRPFPGLQRVAVTDTGPMSPFVRLEFHILHERVALW